MAILDSKTVIKESIKLIEAKIPAVEGTEQALNQLGLTKATISIRQLLNTLAREIEVITDELDFVEYEK